MEPANDTRLTNWEVVHHLIRTLDAGEEATARLLASVRAVDAAKADAARDLSYRLYSMSATTAHREIWSRLHDQQELSRVLSLSVNLHSAPVTLEEELFVHTLILHVRTAFKARELGMQFDDDAVAADIRQFFNRPIPRMVWGRSKIFQDREFVEFIESCIAPAEDANRAA